MPVIDRPGEVSDSLPPKGRIVTNIRQTCSRSSKQMLRRLLTANTQVRNFSARYSLVTANYDVRKWCCPSNGHTTERQTLDGLAGRSLLSPTSWQQQAATCNPKPRNHNFRRMTDRRPCPQRLIRLAPQHMPQHFTAKQSPAPPHLLLYGHRHQNSCSQTLQKTMKKSTKPGANGRRPFLRRSFRT